MSELKDMEAEELFNEIWAGLWDAHDYQKRYQYRKNADRAYAAKKELLSRLQRTATYREALGKIIVCDMEGRMSYHEYAIAIDNIARAALSEQE